MPQIGIQVTSAPLAMQIATHAKKVTPHRHAELNNQNDKKLKI